MKNFLVTFMATADTFSGSDWMSMDPYERKEREQAGTEAWGNWAQQHAVSIVDPGSPIGKTKRTSRLGVADTRNAITAYTIVRADSHEAAASMFENHPHFMIFPGDSVEIMECLPMPPGTP